MTVGTDHPAVSAYLARLDVAAARLPAGRRQELLAEIRTHLDEALREVPAGDEAAVFEVLDRLGPPEDIVAAEAEGTVIAPPAPGPPPPTSSRWGPIELLAVLGLTVGFFVLPVLGPLAGIVLVWVSTRWRRWEKWVATLLTALPLLVLALGASFLVSTGSTTVGDQQVSTETVAPADQGGR